MQDNTTSVSVEMWVNLDAGGQIDVYPMPFNKGGHSAGVKGYYMGGGYDGEDARKMKFGISDGQVALNSPSTVPLNNGQWYHLVGYADLTRGKIGIYLNGTLVGENTIPTTVGSLSNTNQAATIGGWCSH